jgi:hypothetical protein
MALINVAASAVCIDTDRPLTGMKGNPDNTPQCFKLSLYSR